MGERKLGCSGKVRHPDMHSAKIGMMKLVEMYPEKTYNCYKCPHCGKYHVGSLARI